MTQFDPDAESGNVAAVFDCARCDGIASTVTLVPPDEVDPQAMRSDGLAHDLAGLDVLEEYRLSIDGPLHVTHTLFTDEGPPVMRVLAALASGDPVALYALNRDFVRFWCPTCALSYCGNEWTMRAEYDDGFYDYSIGRCPEGHERIVDD